MNRALEVLAGHRAGIDEAVAEQANIAAHNESVAAMFAGEITPVVQRAVSAAYDLATTGGEMTPQIAGSLRLAGFNDNVMSYAAPFVLAGEAALPPDMPVPGLTIAPLVTAQGYISRAYLNSHGHTSGSVLRFRADDYSNARKIPLPVLVDPTTYTFEEYRALPEEAANGFAAQVASGWGQLSKEHRGDPSYHRFPRIVRALGVLPLPHTIEQPKPLTAPGKLGPATGFEFAFTPSVRFAPGDDGRRCVYLADVLLRGDTHAGGGYVRRNALDKEAPVDVLMNRGGKAAPFGVRAAEQVAEGDMPGVVTPRSQGALAVYLTPRLLELRRSAPASALPVPRDHASAPRVAFREGVGGASVDAGDATWQSADRRAVIDGHNPVADHRTAPTIFVLQLLTVR